MLLRDYNKIFRGCLGIWRNDFTTCENEIFDKLEVFDSYLKLDFQINLISILLAATYLLGYQQIWHLETIHNMANVYYWCYEYKIYIICAYNIHYDWKNSCHSDLKSYNSNYGHCTMFAIIYLHGWLVIHNNPTYNYTFNMPPPTIQNRSIPLFPYICAFDFRIVHYTIWNVLLQVFEFFIKSKSLGKVLMVLRVWAKNI